MTIFLAATGDNHTQLLLTMLIMFVAAKLAAEPGRRFLAAGGKVD